MDIYLRMLAEYQKDLEKLYAELLKLSEQGQLKREKALTELDQQNDYQRNLQKT